MEPLPKILAILDSTNILQEELFSLNGVDVHYVYPRESSLTAKIKRRMLLEMGNGERYYEKQLNLVEFHQYDLIIVNEAIFPENIIKFIRKFYSGRLIYLMWNTVKYSGGPLGYRMEKHFFALLGMRKKYDFRIISFDLGDCKQYGLEHQNQFAHRYELLDEDECYDVSFIGRDKGRAQWLEEILNVDKDLKCCIQLLPDSGKKYSEQLSKYLIQQRVPYSEALSLTNKSKCIIDLVQDGQNGLTWRPLEAMFYNKKLITNYQDMVTYDFYRHENIFILGKDDLRKLKEFINQPYVPVSEVIIGRYQFNGWIKKVMQDY